MVVAVAVTYPSAQLAEETAIVGVSAGTFVAVVVTEVVATEVVVTFVAVVTSVVAAEEMVDVDAGILVDAAVEDAVEL